MASLFKFVCLKNVFWCIFSCFQLSVLVQVIAWKDLSLKWPVICRAGCKTLLTHSLTVCDFLTFQCIVVKLSRDGVRYDCRCSRLP